MARRKKYRLTQTECKWRTIIAAWRDSGLTAREFCEKNGLGSHKTLHVWSSKINKIDADPEAKDEFASFVPVQVIGEEETFEAKFEPETIDVYLAGGDIVCVPRNCEMQQVAQIVAILRKEWQ